MKTWLKNCWLITGLFGYNNFKFLIKEFVKLYSSQPSFFSKKRVESNVAFVIMQWGMIKYFIAHYLTMDTQSLVLWASVEGLICGYMIDKIQKDKKIDPTQDGQTS